MNGEQVEIRRSSNSEVRVVAARDLAVGELAVAPSVPSLQFISVRKPGVVPQSNAVAVASPLGAESLVINPCTRFPPRGVLLKDWEKEAFASPCWLMGRSPNAQQANCSWVPVPIHALARLGLGSHPLDLGTHTATDFHKGELGLLTNHKAVRRGDDLIIECGEAAKRPRQGKTLQWHDTVKKPTKAPKQA